MTLRQFPFNGTSGAAITTGNSGVDTVQGGTNSTQTYQAAAAWEGTAGARLVSDGTAASVLIVNYTSATTGAASVRFKIPTAPASNIGFLYIQNSTGNIMFLEITSTGQINAVDIAGTRSTILTAGQATVGTSFRFELVVTALSATTGAFTARAYSSGSTQVGTTASSTTANTGTTNLNRVFIGPQIAATWDFDDLQTRDGGTTEIGEYATISTPPTVVAGANQTTTAGVSVNVTCTATPATGASISSYSWSVLSAIDNTGASITFPTLTNATSQTASFTTTAAKFGRYILQVTATDNYGNTSTAVTTRVFVPGTAICPIEVTSNSTWVTTTVGNVNDSNDGTYAESPASGSSQDLLYRLAPIVAATSGFSMTVRSLVTAVGGSQQVALLEGATVRKDWGAISPGTTIGNSTLTMTSGEMSAVGSWNELDVRLRQL